MKWIVSPGLGSAQADANLLLPFRAGILEQGWVEASAHRIETGHADGIPPFGPMLAPIQVPSRPDLQLRPGLRVTRLEMPQAADIDAGFKRDSFMAGVDQVIG